MRRRTFLRAGLGGGLLLSLSYLLHRPLDRAGKDALVAAHPRADALGEVVAAVAPVLLASTFPVESAAREQGQRDIVAAVATAVAGLSAASQREVDELFALLAFAPTRRLVAGVGMPWAEASAAEIGAFLERWRHSPVDLLKSGYFALHDLILGAWYAEPARWAAIGYPGPPALERR